MNYHLCQNGQEAGIFPEEELRRRRAAGELAGNELVWTDGMDQWRPLDEVLPPAAKPERPKFIAPPPLPPGQKPRVGLNPVVVVLLVFGIGGFLAVAVLFGVGIYNFIRMVPKLKQAAAHQAGVQSSAMDAASRPVVWNTNTLTAAEVKKQDREFRVRQYIAGYQLRGQRSPECDRLAQQFLTNWIAEHYGGPMDTNLPPLSELGDRLANDPDCQDPLVLTVSAVNAVELHEMVRRLERAVTGFENSKHLGYPKLYATEMLADKLGQDQAGRLPALDAQALQDLKAALADGSLRPEDQAQIGEILIKGWGNGFFYRNAAAVCSAAQDRGSAYQWLALTLKGEHEINEAWQARGGYVNSVSDAGWKGFSEHLAAARESLTSAWELHPDWPLAPCRMIYVSLGDSDIAEMRRWFDRTVAAQLDYPEAWSDLRWGLRPRWYGDYDSMLAFGVTALNTHRFDTDVPRKFFDSVSDLEAEMKLPGGQRLFGRDDIWPHIQELYEGYIGEPTVEPYTRDGWRSTYAIVSYLAGKYDVARQQMEALNWQPHPQNLNDWNRDLTVMPLEVAARTGAEAAQVTDAEARREKGNVNGALNIYHSLSEFTNVDALTVAFVQERMATLGLEQDLQHGQWVDFLPTDTNFSGWHVAFGDFKLRPDGALEVKSGQYGHLIYSRARMGTDFEVRGQFEVVSSRTTAFQAGLVMGVPQYEADNWYAFRVKRNNDEHDVASFSQNWTTRQISAPVPLDGRSNSFDFRFHNGLVTATVDDHEVFRDAAPPKDAYVATNEFYVGLGAFNDSNSTVIRYRQIQARRLSP